MRKNVTKEQLDKIFSILGIESGDELVIVVPSGGNYSGMELVIGQGFDEIQLQIVKKDKDIE